MAYGQFVVNAAFRKFATNNGDLPSNGDGSQNPLIQPLDSLDSDGKCQIAPYGEPPKVASRIVFRLSRLLPALLYQERDIRLVERRLDRIYHEGSDESALFVDLVVLVLFAQCLSHARMKYASDHPLSPIHPSPIQQICVLHTELLWQVNGVCDG
jgi:hypothetical protein